MIKILDDQDFNYAEVRNVCIRNLTGLPTGLDASHTGYILSSQSKLWVWDGAKWNTWDAPYWSNQTLSLDETTPPAENTDFNLDVNNLNEPKYAHHITIGFDDSLARTLGTLNAIGTSSYTTDFTNWTGKRIVISARNGCWFNIKNLGSLSGINKQIVTGCETNINLVTKAEFVYRISTDQFILVSYQTIYKNDNTSFQAINYNAASPASLGDIDVSSLNDSTINVHYITVGYPSNQFGSLGSLNSFGTSSTANLTAWRGKKIVLTARGGAYFGIIDQTTSLPTSNYKKIETGHVTIRSTNPVTSVEAVVQAQFIWHETRNTWLLVSYETLKTWFKSYTVPDTGKVSSSTINVTFGNGTSEGIDVPFDGYYAVDVYLDVSEWNSGGTAQVVTTNTQKLEVTSSNATKITLMKSRRQTTAYNVFCESLQGSGIIYITYGNGYKGFRADVNLPNGVLRQVSGGRIDVTYLGNQYGRMPEVK